MPLRNQLSDDCPHHALVSVGGITVMFWWESLLRGSVWFLFLDTFLLSKYFDIRSFMYFAIISKQFRNFSPCHVIKLWELCSCFGWLWTWRPLVCCFWSSACWVMDLIVETLMFPITVMNVTILSLRAVAVEDEEVGSRWLRIRGKGWWKQGELGGGLLESPAVNLQTASQSGNDVRQESSNLTAQLHLVIVLWLISHSTFQLLLPAVSFVSCPPLTVFFSSLSHNLVFLLSILNKLEKLIEHSELQRNLLSIWKTS